MIQQPSLPVQQTAVTQQYQQGLVPAAPEFNAIKININGARVDAPSQGVPAPMPMPLPAEQQPEAQQAQNLNYLA